MVPLTTSSDPHGRPHSHSFGQDRRRPGENRTLAVIALTGTAMVVEIGAGLVFGSMALLADGLHMGSHTVALGINAFAYIYARRHAHDTRFSFGTGKVNALGGYTGAILLVVFALGMAWESVKRLITPVEIAFDGALAVAVLGLLVNGASVWILDAGAPRSGSDKAASHHSHHDRHDHHHPHHHDDHNLRSAYLHVLADALTSILAIAALLTGKFFGWIWMDPLMGIVGAVLIAVWSRGLLVGASRVLLDMEAPEDLRESLRESLENRDDRVVDLHVWSIGPNIYAAAVSLLTPIPRPAQDYHRRLPDDPRLVHVTLEVLRHPSSLPGEPD